MFGIEWEGYLIEKLKILKIIFFIKKLILFLNLSISQ